MASKTIASIGKKDQSSIDLPALKPIPSRRRSRANANAEIAHVYLMENRRTGMMKVGRTISLQVRISEVAAATGTEAGERAYWGWVSVCRDLAPKLEAALHKEWSDVRLDGEWFDLRAKLVLGDVNRVALSICGPDFKVSGLCESQDKGQEGWETNNFRPFKSGGIAGRRMG